MLALLTIAGDAGGYLFVTLSVSLCIYLTIHVTVQPFQYQRINRMETVCMLVLIVVLGFVNGSEFGTGNNEFAETILALFLLLIMSIPLLMVLYEMVRICRHGTTTQISIERFEKIQNRKTTANSTAGKSVEMSERPKRTADVTPGSRTNLNSMETAARHVRTSTDSVA